MKLANGFGLALAAAVVFALAGGIVRAGAADFPFEGEGADWNPYLISSAADWDALSALIEEGAGTDRVSFKQTGDFTVSTMLGTRENPFKGRYDGGGRTLTVSIASDADYAAPFRWICRAKIRNLGVAGSVSGRDYASGLVGGIVAGEEHLGIGRIENCGVSVNVESSHGGEHAGGVVGHGGTSKTEVVGCVFSGGIAGAKHAGTLWGWSDDGARPLLECCLDVSRSDHPIGAGGGLPGVFSVYYTNPDKGEGGERAWKDDGDHGTLVYAVTGGEDVSLACNDDVLSEYDEYMDEDVPLQYDVSGVAFHESAVLYGGILYAEPHRTVYDVTGDEHRLVHHLRLVPIVPDLEHLHLSDCYTNGAIYVEVNGGTVNFYNHPTERTAETLVATGTLSGVTVTFWPVHYDGPLDPGTRSLEGTFFVPTGALENDVDIAFVPRHVPVALAPSYLGPTNEYRELVGFTATAGTLAKDGETGYRLEMTNENVTINAVVVDRVDLEYVNARGESQPVLRPSQYRLARPDTAELDGGWWAVSGAVTNDARLVVSGDVNLVLMDGAELVVPRGIDVTAEDGVTNGLTIWAQSGGTGVLYAGTTNGLDGTCDLHAAAIGGRHGCENAGAITVNGGIVSAVGGTYGAGIGGGSDAGFLGGKGGTVAIKGGTVTARSDGGAAIGWGGGIGGSPASHGLLVIDGMKVADPAGILADDREDVCRAEDGASVTLVVCDPHDYDGARCKWCGAPAPPVVSNVVARQRWPWNGLVDVDYEVGGWTTGLVAQLSFEERGGQGRVWVATNFLADAEPSAEPGPHRATWDTAADGVTNVVAAEVTATVELMREE